MIIFPVHAGLVGRNEWKSGFTRPRSLSHSLTHSLTHSPISHPYRHQPSLNSSHIILSNHPSAYPSTTPHLTKVASLGKKKYLMLGKKVIISRHAIYPCLFPPASSFFHLYAPCNETTTTSPRAPIIGRLYMQERSKHGCIMSPPLFPTLSKPSQAKASQTKSS